MIRFSLFSRPTPVDPATLPATLESAIREALADADAWRASGDNARATQKVGEAFALHRSLVRLGRRAA